MATASRKIVTFTLDTDVFGFDVAQVERVLVHRAPTVLPDAPDWLLGVLEHAGRVVPVVGMRQRMSLPVIRPRFQSRIMLLQTAKGTIGAAVDAVLEVARFAEGEIEPPPAIYRGIPQDFLRGLVTRPDHIVMILDADRVLTGDDRLVLERLLAEAPTA
jgi:purine-binding chemotaxis protein CheW